MNNSETNSLYPYGMKRVPVGISASDILRRLGEGSMEFTVARMTEASAFVSPLSITYYLDGQFSILCDSFRFNANSVFHIVYKDLKAIFLHS